MLFKSQLGITGKPIGMRHEGLKKRLHLRANLLVD